MRGCVDVVAMAIASIELLHSHFFEFLAKEYQTKGKSSLFVGFLAFVEGIPNILKGAGFQEFVYEDYFDVFKAQVAQLAQPGVRVDDMFNKEYVSDSIIVIIRFLSSAHFRRHSESYRAFLDESLSDENFCALYFENMGKESDQINITVLADILNVCLQIVYLDRSASDECTFHKCEPLVSSPEPPTETGILLLYRPGHYDILYLDEPSPE